MSAEEVAEGGGLTAAPPSTAADDGGASLAMEQAGDSEEDWDESELKLRLSAEDG